MKSQRRGFRLPKYSLLLSLALAQLTTGDEALQHLTDWVIPSYTLSDVGSVISVPPFNYTLLVPPCTNNESPALDGQQTELILNVTTTFLNQEYLKYFGSDGRAKFYSMELMMEKWTTTGGKTRLRRRPTRRTLTPHNRDQKITANELLLGDSSAGRLRSTALQSGNAMQLYFDGDAHFKFNPPPSEELQQAVVRKFLSDPEILTAMRDDILTQSVAAGLQNLCPGSATGTTSPGEPSVVTSFTIQTPYATSSHIDVGNVGNGSSASNSTGSNASDTDKNLVPSAAPEDGNATTGASDPNKGDISGSIGGTTSSGNLTSPSHGGQDSSTSSGGSGPATANGSTSSANEEGAQNDNEKPWYKATWFYAIVAAVGATISIGILMKVLATRRRRLAKQHSLKRVWFHDVAADYGMDTEDEKFTSSVCSDNDEYIGAKGVGMGRRAKNAPSSITDSYHISDNALSMEFEEKQGSLPAQAAIDSSVPPEAPRQPASLLAPASVAAVLAAAVATKRNRDDAPFTPVPNDQESASADGVLVAAAQGGVASALHPREESDKSIYVHLEDYDICARSHYTGSSSKSDANVSIALDDILWAHETGPAAIPAEDGSTGETLPGPWEGSAAAPANDDSLDEILRGQEAVRSAAPPAVDVSLAEILLGQGISPAAASAGNELIPLEDFPQLCSLQAPATADVAVESVTVVPLLAANIPFVIGKEKSSGGLEDQSNINTPHEGNVGERKKVVMFSKNIPDGSSRRQTREERSMASIASNAESWRLIRPSRYVGDEGVSSNSTLPSAAPSSSSLERELIEDGAPKSAEGTPLLEDDISLAMSKSDLILTEPSSGQQQMAEDYALQRLMLTKQSRRNFDERSALTSIANDSDSKGKSLTSTLKSSLSIRNDPNLTEEDKAFHRMLLARSMHAHS